ncbi:hypothetical protein VTN77DRAFT_4181 [Rasamsonia byssochlamydoides]|uniref:uncharacterized protein n=1 Tax=Rasamsonia byssochlamydoides TaxID=89139 RepID=UPI003742FD6F
MLSGIRGVESSSAAPVELVLIGATLCDGTQKSTPKPLNPSPEHPEPVIDAMPKSQGVTGTFHVECAQRKVFPVHLIGNGIKRDVRTTQTVASIGHTSIIQTMTMQLQINASVLATAKNRSPPHHLCRISQSTA